MRYCPHCDRKLPDHVEICPTCGFPVTKFIKEPEDHGFYYLVVNQITIPIDC